MSAAVAEMAAPALCAALLAVDPVGLGGIGLRSGHGPARERWLASLAALLPLSAPWRRAPLHAGDDRLFGGLDIALTLQAGRPIALRGLLAEADGGIVVFAMAERLGLGTAARVAAVIDAQAVVAERHGVGLRADCRFGVVALDEGQGDDEQLPARLADRLAFRVQLPTARLADVDVPALYTRDDVAAARARYAGVQVDAEIVQGLCATALALGVDSVRAALFACRAARAAAALDGRDAVNADDASLAAALVLAPRATRLPATDAAPAPADAAPDPSDDAADAPQDDAHDEAHEGGEATPSSTASASSPPDGASETDPPGPPNGALDDAVLEAALAAIPPGLLASLALGNAPRRLAAGGRVGAVQSGLSRGRPIGARRGEPRGGARLHVIETLRAAAPWQPLRCREALAADSPGDARLARAPRIHVRREDFRVWRHQQRSETTTIFVVDASGSAALHRLAEAKGAVELLLADCYVRRDQVAVIAFRGAGADLLLPPTRSLVRAKRSLAALPGGGGTPLAAGIDAAHALADLVRRRGATPVVVLLTDGRANIARDGAPGRARAGADALAAAQRLRADAVAVLLLDTSPQPQAQARDLAATMGARYFPLPHADAARLSQAVRAVGTR